MPATIDDPTILDEIKEALLAWICEITGANPQISFAKSLKTCSLLVTIEGDIMATKNSGK